MYCKGLLLHYLHFKIKNKQKNIKILMRFLEDKKSSFNFKLKNTHFQIKASVKR